MAAYVMQDPAQSFVMPTQHSNEIVDMKKNLQPNSFAPEGTYHGNEQPKVPAPPPPPLPSVPAPVQQQQYHQPRNGINQQSYQHQQLNMSERSSAGAAASLELDQHENAVALKLLVTNNVAGSLIGKGGMTINELQMTSGARIKLSQAQDFFPNTRDRIVLILGSQEEVAIAQGLILYRVFYDQHTNRQNPMVPDAVQVIPPQSLESTFTMQARFIIPSRSAGALIGQAGNNIKELHEHSGAKIQLHNRNGHESIQDLLKERIVTVQGTLKACILAVELCLKKLVDEHSSENPIGTLKYQNMTTSYSRLMNNHLMVPLGTFQVGGQSMMQMPANHMGPGPMQQQIYQNPGLYSTYGSSSGGRSSRQSNIGPGFSQTSMATVTVTLPVPDHLIGSILGRGGQRLTEIQQVSGARISVSQRDDYIPGTQNRTVTIVGSQQAAHTAQVLILSKIEEAQNHYGSHNYSQGRQEQNSLHRPQMQHQQHQQQHHQIHHQQAPWL